MSDQVPAAPAASAPAQATAPTAPAPAPDAKDASASDAARILAARRAKLLPAKEPLKDAAPAEPPKGEATKADAPKVEDDDARLAALVREDRRLKAERAKFSEEQARHRAEADADASDRKVLATMREALANGDRIAAIKALFPEEDLYEGLFYDLLRMAPKDGDGGSQQDVQALVKAELAKADEAREAARREAAARDLGTAREGYAQACAAELQAHVADFPLVKAYGFTVEEMEDHVKAAIAKTGRAPDPIEVLRHFEAAKHGRLKGTRYEPREAAPTLPAPSITADVGRNNGVPTNGNGHTLTFEEKRELLRQRLGSMRAAS